MSDKFIDKTRLNVDRTTNATGIMSAIGGVSAAIDGITHGRPAGEWLPMVMIGAAGAIAQWLQGSPSQRTKFIESVLQIEESRTNAELLRNIFGRILSSGVGPGIQPDAVDSNRPTVDRPGDYRVRGVLDDRVSVEPDVLDHSGNRPATDIATQVAADYWGRNPQRLPNVPSPDAPSNLPEWLEFSQSDRIDTEF